MHGDKIAYTFECWKLKSTRVNKNAYVYKDYYELMYFMIKLTSRNQRHQRKKFYTGESIINSAYNMKFSKFYLDQNFYYLFIFI